VQAHEWPNDPLGHDAEPVPAALEHWTAGASGQCVASIDLATNVAPLKSEGDPLEALEIPTLDQHDVSGPEISAEHFGHAGYVRPCIDQSLTRSSR
jgi:hypothetical protein